MMERRNVVVMWQRKGAKHMWVLIYDDESYVDAMAYPLKWWQDDSLKFGWDDAIAMSRKVREEGTE